MDVTVIDNRDLAGGAAALFRYGEVTMTSVHTMVNNVMRCIGSRKIRRLNIIDHGQRIVRRGTDKTLRMVLEFGDDRVDILNIESYRVHFERLRGKFQKRGFVHLQHCHAGQDLNLLTRLARILGVRVYAGTGLHAGWTRFNFGDYVLVFPDGRAPVLEANRPD